MNTKPNESRNQGEGRSGGAKGAEKKAGGKKRQKRMLRKLIGITAGNLILIAAAVIILSHLALPVFRIYGGNMEPTLRDGDYIAAIKHPALKRNDVVAFYYNNKVLVKRVIALGGDTLDMAGDGTVSVNGEIQDEPFLNEKDAGRSDIEMPYYVPLKHVFVMGDNRADSMDSRIAMIGPAGKEQIIGKAVLRLWPLNRFGFL